jgi:hypothetical protein
LGSEPESVHESVRAKLAPNLEARPSAWPRDPATLDQYEQLIEQTLLAGRAKEAFDLYWHGLGAYGNLGWVLGDYGRCLRILERFVPGDDFTMITPYDDPPASLTPGARNWRTPPLSGWNHVRRCTEGLREKRNRTI